MTNAVIPELKNLDKLEEVLDGIWSGELEYEQDVCFYGTACCVAGWLAVLNTELGKVIPPEERAYLHSSSERFATASPDDIRAMMYPWAWSQEFLGITASESALLFDVLTSRKLQELTLKALKEGRRLDDDVVHTWPDEYSPDCLNLECDSPSEVESLSEFLGIDTITLS